MPKEIVPRTAVTPNGGVYRLPPQVDSFVERMRMVKEAAGPSLEAMAKDVMELLGERDPKVYDQYLSGLQESFDKLIGQKDLMAFSPELHHLVFHNKEGNNETV